MDSNIFKLEVIVYTDADGEESVATEFGVICREIIYLPSLKDAEDLMRNPDFATVADPFRIYRFLLKELPMRQVLYRGEYLSARMYDVYGHLIEETVCSDFHGDWHQPAGRYMGRNPERIRFKPGDIVEYYDGCEKVSFGVVVSTPIDMERCRQIMMNVMENPRFSNISDPSKAYFLDATDDCYTVITSPDYIASHEHVPSIYVSAPSRPVPEEVREQLIHAFNHIAI